MLTDEMKGKILHRLSRQGKFAHSHTAIEHLHRGFPPETRGLAKACVTALIRDGILREKKTSYGVQVSIDVTRREEILRYVRAFLEK